MKPSLEYKNDFANEISRLYMDVTQLTMFPKQDDYKHALKLVADATRAEIRKYEDEYKTQWRRVRRNALSTRLTS